MSKDVIDKLRHWLIKKLSWGDMLMVNVEIRSDGSLIPRNLGPGLIDNCEIAFLDKWCGVRIGRCYSGGAALAIAGGEVEISRSVIRSALPARSIS